MDKNEYQAKLEEINRLIEKESYEEAVRLADTIEWKRVRSVRVLCLVSELYEVVGRAEDSKAILYRAYRRAPNSRQILYRLTEACVQTQDFDDAVEYYTEYVNLSPNDNSKYILKYEIYKGRGSSLEEQIAVLEELKSKEYTEQWAYELARLYDEAGMTDKCVAECDDLALWFHNGKYVVQALELKKKYAKLTREQQTVYDNPSEIVDMETKEQVVEKAVPTLDEVITKELPKSEKDVIADSIIMDTEKEIAAAVQAPVIPAAEPEEVPVPEPAQNQAAEPAAQTGPKVSVQDISTVELQSELAGSMREILSGARPAPVQEELESIPLVSRPSAAVDEDEEQVPGQMHIDDLLTGMADQKEDSREDEKESLLKAHTTDISQKVQKETGRRSVRDYIADRREKAAKAVKRSEQMQIPEAPQPAPIPKEILPKQMQRQEEAARAMDTDAQQAEAMRDMQAQQAEAMRDMQAQQAKAMRDAQAQQAKAMQDMQAASAREMQAWDEPMQEQQLEAAQDEAAAVQDAQEKPVIDPESYTHDSLDEKEKSMLGFWSRIRGMNEQVNEVVTLLMRSILANKTSSKGNVLLVGDAGNGRTTLAISLAKIICRCKGMTSVKVAKIYAEDLNKKDIAATVSKMAGGFLIIEEAGDLSDAAVEQLSMAMDFKTDSLVVALEDEKRYLQDLLARSPKFAEKFDVTVNVPMLTNDELVEFGRYYADEKDCVLDNSAIETLYENIGAIQSPDQAVSILDVKEIVDKAIKNVNRFGVGRITSSISGKRYDSNDKIVLKAKNFKKIK